MKIKIIIPILIIFVGTLIFFLKRNPLNKSELESRFFENNTKDHSILEQVSKKENSAHSSKKLQMDRLEVYYDQVEQYWSNEVRDLFIDEMKLSQTEFIKYQNIRANYERDRLESFEKYHDDMVAKHGKNFKFHLTSEETRNQVRDIDIKHRKELIKVIGEENYVRYLEVRDKFNEKAKVKDDHQYGSMEIEF